MIFEAPAEPLPLDEVRHPSQSELIAGVLDAVQTAPVSAEFVLERLLEQFAG